MVTRLGTVLGTSLGTELGSFADAITAEQTVAALNPYSWIRADNVTVSSGKVVAWVDKALNGHSFFQGTGANQAPAPANDAALAGSPSVDMTGAANTIAYSSTLSAASWAFLHSGTGVNMFTVYVPTNTGANSALYATRVTVPGIDHLMNTLGNTRVADGSIIFANVQVAGVNANGVATYQDYSHDNAATPKFRARYKGGTPADFSPANTPSSAAPGMALRIGSATSSPANQRLAEQIIFKRRLTDPERLTVQAYFLARYGT